MLWRWVTLSGRLTEVNQLTSLAPIVLLIIKESTIATILPKTDVLKNKQDEIWPVPGALQEEDTLLNCSTHHKDDRHGPKQHNQIPQSRIQSLAYKSPQGSETIVNFHQAAVMM